MKNHSTTRRDFFSQTASAIAAAHLAGGLAAAPITADRLRLASIGVGGMGGADLGSLSSHAKVDVVALCDVDANNLAAAAKRHPNAKGFSDFRKMFAEMAGQIDAVSVSTPDHTHAPAAMTAMNYGKHVYCQKPLTHDVYESRQLRIVSESKKLVTQMGTQIHSASAYRTAVKLIQSGVIGKIRETHSWSSKTWGYEGPDPAPNPVPDFLQWDLWLGTAPDREYAQGHFHPGNWRRWYDYGCGTMGDMAIHILDPVFSALKLGNPTKVISSSSAAPQKSFGMQNHTRYTFGASAFTTSDFLLTWSDGGKMPDTTAWPLEGADGKRMGLPDQGSIFLGEKGAVLLPHVAMPVLLPAKQFADYKIEAAPDGNHYHLFVDACLGGAPTTAHFGYAGPLTEAVLLGTLANRFPGSELQWNADAISVPNHALANALLRRTYRKGFEVDNLS
ncbi:MAG: Gfo/Idh/MocA family oxidoreductase [Planctomycetota bacterium]|nr:Gfo/Idh/MocA family oxidoreductase [Planctomycetota bacterium]RLT15835.1 MAG: gfo/Idh/MocA family oxidoreductase [Planctomycetota bacterium]